MIVTILYLKHKKVSSFMKKIRPSLAFTNASQPFSHLKNQKQ